MNYEFKDNIDPAEYDKFVRNYSSSMFMQTSGWAKIKDAWDSSLVGMYHNKKLVCTALILKRKLIFNKKLFYIPRGFVIDYKDKDLLCAFVSSIKNYAKKNGAISIKIDPYICFSEDNIQNIKKNKDIKVRQVFTKDTNQIKTNLEELGFIHGGYKKEVNAYIQPRYTMAVALKDEQNNFYDKDSLRRTFPKNTRNYIGTYHDERGVEFCYSHDINDVKKLVEVLHMTEKRQHVALRNENYFMKLMETYKDNAILFFAYVDIDKYLEFLKEDEIKNPDKLDFCSKQRKEALAIKEKYGNKPLAGATIVMMPTCNNGIKIASFLYAGTNTEILPSLKITNGLMYYRLCYCLEHGCDYCDLGGIDGSLEDHLSVFKSKFNPQVLELVGEFDLVISKFWYKIFNLAVGFIKFLRS